MATLHIPVHAVLVIMLLLLCVDMIRPYTHMNHIHSRYAHSVRVSSQTEKAMDVGERTIQAKNGGLRGNTGNLSERLKSMYANRQDDDLVAFYKSQKMGFNIGLKYLLQRNVDARIATGILTVLGRERELLQPDTVNMFISNAFYRHDVAMAEDLYKRYFGDIREGQYVTRPAVRTLNIMIEGLRTHNMNAKINRYLQQFPKLRLDPDEFTYSTLVRIAKEPQSILSILQRAEKSKVLSAPLVRCAVETLGQLGAPNGAVVVALTYLVAEESIFASAESGDCLLQALFQHPFRSLMSAPDNKARADSIPRDTNSVSGDGDVDSNRGSNYSDGGGDYSDDGNKEETNVDADTRMEWQNILRKQGIDASMSCEEAAFCMFLKSPFPNGQTLCCGSRGLVSLFTSLGRTMRYLYIPAMAANINAEDFSFSITPGGLGSGLGLEKQERKLRIVALRKRRERVLQKALEMIQQSRARADSSDDNDNKYGDGSNNGSNGRNKSDCVPNSTAPHQQMQKSRDVLQLNGRLCDAVIRCYMDDITTAKRLWRMQLLPLARSPQAQGGAGGSRLPSIQTADDVASIVDGDYNEIAYKSLQALMYISGLHYRADTALEIAKSARKRTWPKAIYSRLAQEYSRGKLDYMQRNGMFTDDISVPSVVGNSISGSMNKTATTASQLTNVTFETVDTLKLRSNARSVNESTVQNSSVGVKGERPASAPAPAPASIEPASPSLSVSEKKRYISERELQERAVDRNVFSVFADVLNEGLEASIQCELGEVFEFNQQRYGSLKNIRFLLRSNDRAKWDKSRQNTEEE